jgi:hypothetical protein
MGEYETHNDPWVAEEHSFLTAHMDDLAMRNIASVVRTPDPNDE